MTNKATVEEFLTERTLAVVGVSRSGKKFGNTIFRELKDKGYRVYPVNPAAEEIEGVKCYPDIATVPKDAGGVVVVVPPAQTVQVVRDALRAGIRKLWIQQGAESQEALAFCETNGLNVVSNECILMFAPPVGSIHKFHRFIWKLFGKLPR
jgi:hypothetical protein